MRAAVFHSPGDVRIGMRVAVVFERHGDVYLPLFAPVAEPVEEAGADA